MTITRCDTRHGKSHYYVLDPCLTLQMGCKSAVIAYRTLQPKSNTGNWPESHKHSWYSRRTARTPPALSHALPKHIKCMLQPTALTDSSLSLACLNSSSHSLRGFQEPPGHMAKISMENKPAHQEQASEPVMLRPSMITHVCLDHMHGFLLSHTTGLHGTKSGLVWLSRYGDKHFAELVTKNDGLVDMLARRVSISSTW